jgi:hypothetical protein
MLSLNYKIKHLFIYLFVPIHGNLKLPPIKITDGLKVPRDRDVIHFYRYYQTSNKFRAEVAGVYEGEISVIAWKVLNCET